MRAALSPSVANPAWQPTSWRADLATTIADGWMRAPELGERVHTLRGLDPAVYLTQQAGHAGGRPRARAARPRGPALLRRAARQDPRPLPPASHQPVPRGRRRQPPAHPPSAAPRARPRRRPRPRRAPARASRAPRSGRGHPLARRHARRCCSGSGEAARSGRFSPVSALSALAADLRAPATVRRGALLGLGKAGWADPAGSVEALGTELVRIAARRSTAPPSRRCRSWRAGGLPRPSPATGMRCAPRSDGSSPAELARPEAATVEQTLLEALAVVAHPASRGVLEEIRSRASSDASVRDRVSRALERLDASIAGRR